MHVLFKCGKLMVSVPFNMTGAISGKVTLKLLTIIRVARAFK